MGKKVYSLTYLSVFCSELSAIMRAGITVSDGMLMLAEDEIDNNKRKVLISMVDGIEHGQNLHEAFEKTDMFPVYMIEMLEIGEKTGRMEAVLASLSVYYNRQQQILSSLKSAVIYPAVLIAMLLAVVLVLITKVLPIFNDVFNQLGINMSPAAIAMMNFGNIISSSIVYILGIIIILVLLIIILSRIQSVRKTINNLLGKMKLARNFSTVRFASTLSMTISSGLNIDESLEMSRKLIKNPGMQKKISDCQKLMAEGASFANSIVKTGIFPSVYSRMITIGFKTGQIDGVISDIAKKAESSFESSVEHKMGRIEPTLVIIMSVIVGFILLSVMLPLMGIMSSIG